MVSTLPSPGAPLRLRTQCRKLDCSKLPPSRAKRQNPPSTKGRQDKISRISGTSGSGIVFSLRLYRHTLVGRFISSVTYFLGRFGCRTVELVQHSSEIALGEPPLERFGDGFVMSLESEQTFC